MNLFLRLLRGDDASKDDRTLGQILLDKADQGVQVFKINTLRETIGHKIFLFLKVFMLVWSDKTNIMGTHDDETRSEKYFSFTTTRLTYIN